MQKVLTTILLTLSLASYGQKGKFNPFKLIILKPDTAIIDKSLYGDIDSIEATYRNRYYKSIEVNEGILQCESCDSSMKEEIKNKLLVMKSYEEEVKKFKYYQLVSSYSTEVYNFYFNEYEPYSTIIESPARQTDEKTLKELADSAKADYIIFFRDIHTEIRNDLPILKLTTLLYSRADNKILLTKETEGDMNSRGDMWTCFSPLSCLFINGIKTSTDAVAPEIAKRQIRH